MKTMTLKPNLLIETLLLLVLSLFVLGFSSNLALAQDADGDGLVDIIDPDDDNDGIPDLVEFNIIPGAGTPGVIDAFDPNAAAFFQVINAPTISGITFPQGQLFIFNPLTAIFEPLGTGSGASLNSIGFDPVTGLIYGVAISGLGATDALGAPIADDDIVVLDRDGEIFRLGSTGLDLAFAADIFDDQLYVTVTPNAGGQIAVVNLDGTLDKTFTVAGATMGADLASTGGGDFFTLSGNTLSSFNVNGVANGDVIAATTATVSGPLPAATGYGGSYPATNPVTGVVELYFSNNTTGEIFRIDDPLTPNPTAVLVFQGIPTSSNDGAASLVAPPPSPADLEDTDRDGVPDFLDLDSDNDGIPDAIEAGPNPATPVDTDGDGIPDFLDLDSDNDGIPDTQEAGSPDADGDGIVDCSTIPSFSLDGFCDDVDPVNGGTAVPDPDTDGDGIVDRLDIDSDNDGLPDIIEAGGVDLDGDGRIDDIDPATGELLSDADADGLSDFVDPDNNGTLGVVDGTGTPLPDPDGDGDGLPDYLDLDSDNDGIPDTIEAGSTDLDGDGIIDCTVPFGADGFCPDVDSSDGGTAVPDPDIDGDGNPDRLDLDSDNDGLPDVEESGGPDADGDGVVDCTGAFAPDGFCPDVDPGDGGTPVPLPDLDGDGVPDHEDLDSDNDGIPDVTEAGGPDADNDGVIDCTGAFAPDGFCPDVDTGDGGTPLPAPDTDGDGDPDHEDLDSDNDGTLDVTESGGADADGDGLVDCPTPFGPNGFCPALSGGDPEADLRSPIYVKWNTFLSQFNFLELAVEGTGDLDIEVTVFNLLGVQMNQTTLSVAGGTQQDIDINALVQGSCDAGDPSCAPFVDLDGSGVIDSYGLVRVAFDDSDTTKRLVGRLSNYRPEAATGNFSFAFARQFRNPNVGVSYAGANTFDVNGQGFVVPNWVEVINLEDTPQDFTVNLFDATGALVETSSLTLNALEERDLNGGHEITDASGLGVEQAVYLVEVIPADATAEYLMSVARYSSNSQPGFDSGSYNYAFELPGRSGTPGDVFSLITNETLACGNILNWVEVSNGSSATETFTVTFRDSAGAVVGTVTDSYAPMAQINYNASALLPAGEVGSVQVSSTNPTAVVAQSLVYIYECDSNAIQTAYMTRLSSPGKMTQVGTGNTFIQMDNSLRTVNATPVASTVNFDITSFLGEMGTGSIALGANTVDVTDLSDNPAVGFPDDRYGILQTNSLLPGQTVSEVLRTREVNIGGQVRYDFVMPTPVR